MSRKQQTILSKSYEQDREHFIERLSLRYGIVMTVQEYEVINQSENVHKNYKGIFSKGAYKSLGILNLFDRQIVVLRNKGLASFSTCYSLDVLTDQDAFIMAAFIAPLRPTAKILYNYVIEICEKEKRNDFACIKDAAIWYKDNTTFPMILIRQYLYGDYNMFKTMRFVNDLLYNQQSDYVLNMNVKKRKLNREPKAQVCDAYEAEK